VNSKPLGIPNPGNDAMGVSIMGRVSSLIFLTNRFFGIADYGSKAP
jgi:hypothetical protein